MHVTEPEALPIPPLEPRWWKLLTRYHWFVFAVAAVALLAETMPARVRTYSLGMMQAFSAVGNCTAAALFILLGLLELNGYLDGLKRLINPDQPRELAWRLMFLIGLVPALLVIFI